MRLGEIKQILDNVIDEKNNIVLENEAIFDGQAYIVNNYVDVVRALEILEDQEWNDYDSSQILVILRNHPPKRNKQQVTQEEFNQLISYISSLNQKLPYFYSILDSIVEEQDEKCINIKLPEKTITLKELSGFNKQFEETLSLFNIDGGFVFSGFDVGTSWYIVCAEGILSCQFFIACLKVAQELLKTRSEWFKSEEAKLSFEVAKRHSKELSSSDYEKTWLDMLLDNKIKEVIEKIGETNGATKEEAHTKLLKGTRSLIKQLGDGVEFHLSLNPPPYTSEIKGSLEIDYKKIQQMRAKELGSDKQKELIEPKTEKTKEEVKKEE